MARLLRQVEALGSVSARPDEDSSPGASRPGSRNSQATSGARSQRSSADAPRNRPAVSASPDYYALLGVKSDASPAAIQAAYKARIREYHPDLHQGSRFAWVRQNAEQMSKQLGEAYAVLRDPRRRGAYDRRQQRGP